MNAATRQLVRARSENRCEYCRLAQTALPLVTFHVEYVIPKQHGGSDDPDNLALSCHHCNLHKGPNRTGIDPDTNQIAILFNPRQDVWLSHFAMLGIVIEGLTPIGRVTVRVMAMNSRAQLEARTEF